MGAKQRKRITEDQLRGIKRNGTILFSFTENGITKRIALDDGVYHIWISSSEKEIRTKNITKAVWIYNDPDRHMLCNMPKN